MNFYELPVSIYPCGFCELNVNWECQAVCCDECHLWYHKSCLDLGMSEYDRLANTSISWICCKCHTPNLSSFTFRSFDVSTENSFMPLAHLDDSLDPSHFQPNTASTPILNRINSVTSVNASSLDLTTSSMNDSESPVYSEKSNRTNLRILTINLQSIKNKSSDFLVILNYIKPDIVCGTESWLNSNIGDSEVFPTKLYKAYRKDRNQGSGGGVFILVRNDIVSTEIKINSNCELCLVELKFQNIKNQIIGCFYMPHRDINVINNLRNTIEPFKNKNLTICGDFNCPSIDWENGLVPTCVQDKTIQEELLLLTQDLNLSQVHTESTRLDNILDLILTSNPSLVISSMSAPGVSDHDLVITDFNIKVEYQTKVKRTGYNFNKANWVEIKKHLNTTLTPLLENKNYDINQLWDKFKKEINHVKKSFVPSYTIKENHSLPWLNRLLEKCLKKKNKMHAKAKRSGNTKSWQKYKKYQKRCRNMTNQAEKNYVNDKIVKGLSEKNSKPLWQYIKSKRRDVVGISPLNSNGLLKSEPAQKAEILVSKFEEVFTQPLESNLDAQQQIYPDIPDLSISKQGVEKLLNDINVNKANGPDDLPNIILKKCASEIAPFLTMLFQTSINTGILPIDWRSANVTGVFKKGDRHDANNYRPVSLTSVTCKLLEHIVHKHLIIHYEQHKILSDLNHGFRKHYSCDTQLITTLEDLTKSFDKKTQVDIAVLDFSKAFDKVPHRELLHKIERYGVKGSILNWIRSFLCERTMKVVVDGSSSREVPVVSGVPQGTVLGPLLFLSHINDLPSVVSSHVRLFADDCLVYREIKCFEDHHALQKDLAALEVWSKDWGMQFNASKCVILSQNSKSSYFYRIDNQILKNVESTPYLGVEISNDLQWKAHISKTVAKANSTLGLLKRNLKHCPEECKKAAYVAMVRSKLEYGCMIWDPHQQKDIDALERVQRNAARFIKNDYHTRTPGCVTNMLDELQLEPLKERRKTKRLQMFTKIVENQVPSLPPDKFLNRAENRRIVKARTLPNYTTQNIVQNSVNTNSSSFKRIFGKTNQRKYSFIPRTIVDWNTLHDDEVTTLRSSVQGPGGDGNKQ